ncbi:MAG: dihydroorotate dehydrogenase [Lachnospiraceae bacterium]|nr:dihydroorotate dehydrogenase [Lachnospiraceae bacterium]
MKFSVNIAGVTLKNPVMTASGTFGSGMEYSEFLDLNNLGAVVTKGVSSTPWEGNQTPRVAETCGGMMNAIGLQNPGIDTFIERDLKFLTETLHNRSDTGSSKGGTEPVNLTLPGEDLKEDTIPTRIIVNVCGKTTEEYLEVVERLGDTKTDLLEINVSCPNVKEGAIAFGQNRDALYDITKQIKTKAKQPVIMKLSPNVTSISEMAKACEAAGADAISLINTFTAMKIDIHKRRFVLANKTGGLSGPAIRPIAVRMVYECRKAVNIPIIGMGGIASGEDAIEFMMAGANAVAVGMMNFHDPNICDKILKSMVQYMKEYDVQDINELVGCMDCGS